MQSQSGIRPDARSVLGLLNAVLITAVFILASPGVQAEGPQASTGVSCPVNLDGPGDSDPRQCQVVQTLDGDGRPTAYYMDVDSVACAEDVCEVVPVRLHFDALGKYDHYELPSGGNLTKRGHQPFSPADHQRLQQLLTDPYSPLQSIKLDEITEPGTSGGIGVDGISGATVLSKRNVVVVGAAYTCLTLWHWSHGDVVKTIRNMTRHASDREDLVGYVRQGDEGWAVFALDELRAREVFDAEATAAAMSLLRHGSDKLADPALRFLAAASSKTGVDHLLSCMDDEFLLASPNKRVQLLESLRDASLELTADQRDRLSGWLKKADGYYEVHLLFTLLEGATTPPTKAIDGALHLLENDNGLVVRRSYRYLKAQDLPPKQQETLNAFEQTHPDP